MDYYSNADGTKIIATNHVSCIIITKSGMGNNISSYTIPYRKQESELLTKVDKQAFDKAYDSIIARNIDFLSNESPRGAQVLLQGYKKEYKS